jgi:hypothetical protein
VIIERHPNLIEQQLDVEARGIAVHTVIYDDLESGGDLEHKPRRQRTLTYSSFPRYRLQDILMLPFPICVANL